MPNGPAVRMACARRAEAISAFTGTQPACSPLPPILCFSTSTTRRPNAAAIVAVRETARPRSDDADVGLKRLACDMHVTLALRRRRIAASRGNAAPAA